MTNVHVEVASKRKKKKKKKKKKWSETNQPFTNKWGKIGARPPILNFASVK